MRLARSPLILVALSATLGIGPAISAQENGREQPTQEEDLRAVEQRVVDAVNAVRQSRGLEPLDMREDLAELARRHSRDMIDRDFFGHENPDGQDPFDRMRAARIWYRHAGENIAWNNYPNPVWGAVRGWMRSPSHRENVLNARFTHTGVGVSKTDDGRYFITQLFLGQKSRWQLERERRQREAGPYEGEVNATHSEQADDGKATPAPRTEEDG